MKQYYDTLQLPVSASKQEIKRAYYKLAKEYHPDVSTDPEAEEKFISINEAYEILTSSNLNKIRAAASSSGSYRPSRAQQERARRKARQKSKMTAEQFRKYRLGRIKQDMRIFRNMFLGVLFMMLLIMAIIYFSQDPNKASYNPFLAINAGLTLSIPAIGLGLVLGVKYYKLNEDAQFFK